MVWCQCLGLTTVCELKIALAGPSRRAMRDALRTKRKRSLPRTSRAMLHMGLGLLVLIATGPYATYAACCSASNLELIFDLHHAELNEAMGLAQGKQFWQQSTA